MRALTLDTPVKLLNADGSTAHGGRGRWHLPTQSADGSWTPGEWMRLYKSKPIPCERGYHYTTVRHALNWTAPTMWLIEPQGEVVPHDDKLVAQGGRLLAPVAGWNDANLRLFAADCAEAVVHLCGDAEAVCRETIAVARRYARGAATEAELAAAGDAARAAARAAAWDAARAAARAAARDAARDAARAAAWDAARDAARGAAWDAARAAQAVNLLAYLNGERS